VNRKFETDYGYFTEDGSEYVIKTFKTPKPWINILTNGDYGFVISQAGGGFSWKTHSEFNRITRWHQDLIQDNWGKYIYIKNNLTGKFWSPTFLPAKKNLDSFECRHGLGCTVFTSEYQQIKTILTLFVPNDDNLEIWDLKIINQTAEEADLSVFTYFEWCLGSSADHHREFHKTFLRTKFDKNLNAILATKNLWEIPLGDRGHWNIEYEYNGYFSCSKTISDYDTEKENFTGQLGDIINPAAVESGILQKKTGSWNDAAAVTKVDLKLKPNSEERLIYYLGLEKAESGIKPVLEKYITYEQVDSALEAVKQKWHLLLSTLEIETPDEAMNLMVNKWLRYQAIAGRLWARTAYYQQSGAFGFRDQLQDSLVFLPINPAYTEQQIKLHAAHQLEDGTVLHWWHPITETGLETKMTDDLLWLPFVLIQYYKETKNLKFFDEEVEYYRHPDLKESLYKHCIRAIEKVLTRYSKRGLPLIGAGDWNDGLSAVGLEMKGESIWLAEFFYLILNEFKEICRLKNDDELFERYKSESEKLKSAFEKYAWDGEWFYRATKDSGEKIGSRENKEGKIYLNSQTWSVISGITERDKQLKAMQAVDKYLLKNNGTLLLAPAYTKPDKFIGYLSRYAAGRRENGGVYMHAATWAIAAFAILDNNENAYKVFKGICPVYNGLDPIKYAAEPYVTPGNIDGPDSPNYGMGGWTWYTGSASWFQKVIVDWILGVRADENGLIIDPHIPKEWKSFKVKRTFRGCVYNIEIVNPGKASSGVKKIEVDGKDANSPILIEGRNSVSVKVTMG